MTKLGRSSLGLLIFFGASCEAPSEPLSPTAEGVVVKAKEAETSEVGSEEETLTLDRALEALTTEVVGLREDIDGLRGDLKKLRERSGERPPLLPAAPSSKTLGSFGEVVKVSKKRYKIPAALIAEAKKNANVLTLPELGPYPRWTPYYRDRRLAGFRGTGIKPGSFHHLIGLRSGDTLLKINGEVVERPRQLAEMVRDITPDQPAVIEFERRGQSKTLMLESE